MNLLLGYVHETKNKQALDDVCNFIGGDVVIAAEAEKSRLENVQCRRCDCPCLFIGQLNCPVDSTPQTRVLYVFACVKKQCQESQQNWRVIRFQHDEPGAENPVANKTTAAWSMDVEEEEEEEDENEAWSGELSETIVSTKTAKRDACYSVIPGDFEFKYLDVYDPTDSAPETPAELLQKIADDDLSNLYKSKCSLNSTSHEIEDVSTFDAWLKLEEIDAAFEDDDDDRAAEESRQGQLENYVHSHPFEQLEVIRYFWKGYPIFTSNVPRDLRDSLVCEHCSGPRVFELQLFSTLNNFLTPKTTAAKACDDPSWIFRFTTVLVFTCQNSCYQTPFVDEFVIVQTEKN